MLLSQPKGKGVAPYVAELLGAFFVAVAQGCVLMSGNSKWGPTAIGFSVMMAMYSMNDVSGGYVNPAVTVAMGLCRRLPWTSVLGYSLAQCSGGLLAGVVVWSLQSVPADDTTDSVGIRTVAGGVSAVVVEAFYTTVICFVALNCMACVRGPTCKVQKVQFAAVAVGFVSCAGGAAASGLSFGIFNPASSLCLAVVSIMHPALSSQFNLAHAAVYLAAQLASALVGSCLFLMVGGLLVRPAEFHGTSDQNGERTRTSFHARLSAELIGTLILVTTYGLSKMPYDDLGAGTTTVAPDVKMLPATAQAWAVGTMLASMSYSLYNVSGGHFNPAVTIAALCTGRGECGPVSALLYIIAQLLAGLGGGVACALLRSTTSGLDVGALSPRNDYSWTAALIAEALFTVLVALVVLCTTTLQDSKRYPKALREGNFPFGLAIGFTVASASYALENISGGYLNPALALGATAANILRNHLSALDFASLWVPFGMFAALEVVGGVVAAMLFAGMHSLEYKDDPLLRPSSHVA